MIWTNIMTCRLYKKKIGLKTSQVFFCITSYRSKPLLSLGTTDADRTQTSHLPEKVSNY